MLPYTATASVCWAICGEVGRVGCRSGDVRRWRAHARNRVLRASGAGTSVSGWFWRPWNIISASTCMLPGTRNIPATSRTLEATPRRPSADLITFALETRLTWTGYQLGPLRPLVGPPERLVCILGCVRYRCYPRIRRLRSRSSFLFKTNIFARAPPPYPCLQPAFRVLRNGEVASFMHGFTWRNGACGA